MLASGLLGIALFYAAPLLTASMFFRISCGSIMFTAGSLIIIAFILMRSATGGGEPQAHACMHTCMQTEGPKTSPRMHSRTAPHSSEHPSSRSPPPSLTASPHPSTFSFPTIRHIPHKGSVATVLCVMGSTGMAVLRWLTGQWFPVWSQLLQNPFFQVRVPSLVPASPKPLLPGEGSQSGPSSSKTPSSR
jgi:hypothetical protein